MVSSKNLNASNAGTGADDSFEDHLNINIEEGVPLNLSDLSDDVLHEEKAAANPEPIEEPELEPELQHATEETSPPAPAAELDLEPEPEAAEVPAPAAEEMPEPHSELKTEAEQDEKPAEAIEQPKRKDAKQKRRSHRIELAADDAQDDQGEDATESSPSSLSVMTSESDTFKASSSPKGLAADRPNRKYFVGIIAAAVIVVAILMGAASCALNATPTISDERIKIEPETFASIWKAHAEMEGAPEVELTELYLEKLPFIRDLAMPAYSFSYPESWQIIETDMSVDGEEIVIADADDSIRITFDTYSSNYTSSGRTRCADISKLADIILPYDVSHAMEDYGIAGLSVCAVRLETGSANAFMNGTAESKEFIAVVPTGMDGSEAEETIDVSAGVPAFMFIRPTAFFCEVPDEGLSGWQLKQVMYILSSLTISQ